MKIKLIGIISTMLLALTGCSANKIVYVPTPIKCPSPHISAEPDYPVNYLTTADKNNPPKVGKAYAASLSMCMIDNESMRKQLKGYLSDKNTIRD